MFGSLVQTSDSVPGQHLSPGVSSTLTMLCLLIPNNTLPKVEVRPERQLAGALFVLNSSSRVQLVGPLRVIKCLLSLPLSVVPQPPLGDGSR